MESESDDYGTGTLREKITGGLKRHGATIAMLAVLWAFIVWMPDVAEEQTAWHALGQLAIAAGVVVAAGGHRVLLGKRRTTTAALGLAAFFFALPVVLLWLNEIVSYLFTGPTVSYGANGEYTRPLYLDLLRHLDWGIMILFYVVPMTMGTLIAVAKPSSPRELWEYFWFGVPVIAATMVFTKAMGGLYQVLNPQVTTFTFGFGYFTVETVESALFSSLVFAVAWATGVVAYKKLDEAGIAQEAVTADGGIDR